MKNLIDKSKIRKIGINLLLISFFGGVMYISSLGRKEVKNKENFLEKYQNTLVDYVKGENDTLTKYEKFRIDSLCGVLDKPSDYNLVFEDWKRGYDHLPEKFK